jgi:hypothetical protein
MDASALREKLTQLFGQHVELFHIVQFIQFRVLLPWILGRLGTGNTFFLFVV